MRRLKYDGPYLEHGFQRVGRLVENALADSRRKRMPLMARDTGGGGDYTPVPEGTHLAICNMVVDLGVQETTYMGAVSHKHQCFVRWELPHERIEWTVDGETKEGPMQIGKTYTLSLSDKANLRKDLEAWRGKRFTLAELDGFDLFKLLGIGCQVTVTHAVKGEKTYANVVAVAGWPKGMPTPQATENKILRYGGDETDDYLDLPEWIRNKLSTPFEEPNGQRPVYDQVNQGVDIDDEIPF